jgi:pimeloyl-ACP methyl ester carboxylesterase
MPATLRPLLLALSLLAALVGAAAQESAQTEDRFFDSHGVRLRFIDVGRGHPVILVHGFSVDLDSNWRAPGTVDVLAKDFRVVAFDCRGHGRSDKPHDATRYGRQMVEDVVRLMDNLQLPKAHLVGYSMGASIVGKFVAAHPERVTAAVFSAGTPNVGWTETNARDAAELAAALEKGEGMRPLVLRLWPTDSPKPTEEVLTQRSLAALGRNDPIALACATRQRHEMALSLRELESARIPLLAVVGSVDPVATAVGTLTHGLPALQVKIVDGATHAGTRGLMSHPEFAPAVHAFLRAQSGGLPKSQ